MELVLPGYSMDEFAVSRDGVDLSESAIKLAVNLRFPTVE